MGCFGVDFTGVDAAGELEAFAVLFTDASDAPAEGVPADGAAGVDAESFDFAFSDGAEDFL